MNSHSDQDYEYGKGKLVPLFGILETKYVCAWVQALEEPKLHLWVVDQRSIYSSSPRILPLPQYSS